MVAPRLRALARAAAGGSGRAERFLASEAFRRLYPFRSRYREVRGRRIHYLDEGEGPPVVMVHGNPTWSFYFRELVRALRPSHRCVVPDHVGCGLSEKPGPRDYGFGLRDRVDDLEALLDGLGIHGGITLVVHDWGGMIGLACALRRPERVRRLVVTNTSGFLPPAGKPIPRRLRLIRDLPWLAAPAVLGLNLFALGAVLMAPATPLAPAAAQALCAPYARPRHRLATLRFVQDIPLGPGDPAYGEVLRVDRGLGRLDGLPMLLLWGMKDFVFDRDYLEEWRRRFPKARCRAFPDAGHYLLEDEPRAAADEVLRFLEAHPAGQGAAAERN